jgi:hypothetical protein
MHHTTHARLLLAVQSLASGNASLQSRLNVAGESLVPLLDTDFPDDLRTHFRKIIDDLTSKPAQLEGEGALAATTRQMSHEEAERVAGQIVDLFDEICCSYCSDNV